MHSACRKYIFCNYCLCSLVPGKQGRWAFVTSLLCTVFWCVKQSPLFTFLSIFCPLCISIFLINFKTFSSDSKVKPMFGFYWVLHSHLFQYRGEAGIVLGLSLSTLALICPPIISAFALYLSIAILWFLFTGPTFYCHYRYVFCRYWTWNVIFLFPFADDFCHNREKQVIFYISILYTNALIKPHYF